MKNHQIKIVVVFAMYIIGLVLTASPLDSLPTHLGNTIILFAFFYTIIPIIRRFISKK